jgi:hypothetical protein
MLPVQADCTPTKCTNHGNATPIVSDRLFFPHNNHHTPSDLLLPINAIKKSHHTVPPLGPSMIKHSGFCEELKTLLLVSAPVAGALTYLGYCKICGKSDPITSDDHESVADHEYTNRMRMRSRPGKSGNTHHLS